MSEKKKRRLPDHERLQYAIDNGIPYVRHAYSPRNRVTTTCGESLTKQSFADECDINKIVRRYQETGAIPEMRRQPMFGDFSAHDFHKAQLALARANQLFDQLPSDEQNKYESVEEFINEIYKEVREADADQTMQTEHTEVQSLPESQGEEIPPADSSGLQEKSVQEVSETNVA